MADEKKIKHTDYVVETVHGVRTKVPKEFFENLEKNVKKGVDKDDTV